MSAHDRDEGKDHLGLPPLSEGDDEGTAEGTALALAPVPLLIQLSLEHAIIRGEKPEQVFAQLRQAGLSEELAELILIALGKVMQFIQQHDESEVIEGSDLEAFLVRAGFDDEFAHRVTLGVQAFAEAAR